jgi:hypothetical protein
MIQPPRWASWLLLAALPASLGEAIAGDLHEEFHDYVVPARGVVGARWWYRWQVARSLAPLFLRSWQRASVLRASVAVAVAGFIATIPGVILLMLRGFVLSQVPLKTTPEMSVSFAVAFAAVAIAALTLAVAFAVRVLGPRR